MTNDSTTVTETIPLYKLRYYWGKIAFALLTLKSAYGLWKSFIFLVLEYPGLESQLNAHIISANEVTSLTVAGLITVVNTLISITMAWRLSSVREEVAKNIDLILATIVITATPFLQTYLEALPWLSWIQSIL